MSVYDQFDFTSVDQLQSNTCPSFSHYSSNSAASTSASSTVPSTQSVSHLLDQSIYQRQISTSSSFLHQHQSISTGLNEDKCFTIFFIFEEILRKDKTSCSYNAELSNQSILCTSTIHTKFIVIFCPFTMYT